MIWEIEGHNNAEDNLVFYGDNPNWGDAETPERVSSSYKVRTYTRQQARSKTRDKASSSRAVSIEDDEADSEETEEKAERYESMDGGADDEDDVVDTDED